MTTAVKRMPPLAPEVNTPTCVMCRESTTYEVGRFHCTICACSWDVNDYWSVDGDWDEPEKAQCERTIRPYLGSVRYPSLAKILSRCVLTVDHDGRHRDGDDDWADSDVDGFRTEPEARPAADAPQLLEIATRGVEARVQLDPLAGIAIRAQAVRELHAPDEIGGGLILCRTCSTWLFVLWPCPTLQALDGLQAP